MCQLDVYRYYTRVKYSLVALLLLFSPLLSAGPLLTLDHLQTMALSDDARVQASELRRLSLAELAIAQSQLDDPTLTVGVFNVPIDDFDLNQNASTQLRLGLSQTLAKGDSLQLRKKQGDYAAIAQAQYSELLKKTLIRNVRLHFLETLYRQKSLAILNKNRRYFAELLVTTDNLYAVGRANQQAVLQAKLELSRLDDQINQAVNQLEINKRMLAKWLPQASELDLLDTLPVLPELASLPVLEAQLLQHPEIRADDAYIGAAKQAVLLEHEQYKPGFSVGLEYRKRFGDESNGHQRSDMLAAMLSVDMPLFTDKRQDKRLSAQQYSHQAVKLKRLDDLREMRQQLRRQYGNWQRLQQRSERYQQRLLIEAAAHANAALSGYQNGVIDFSTLMYARIAELDTSLQASRVAIEQLKAQAEVLFYSQQTQQGVSDEQ